MVYSVQGVGGADSIRTVIVREHRGEVKAKTAEGAGPGSLCGCSRVMLPSEERGGTGLTPGSFAHVSANFVIFPP